MIGKRLRKIIRQLLLIFFVLKENKYVQVIFKNINSNCEKQIILSRIPNEEKEGRRYLTVEKLSAFLNEITSKHRVIFIVWIVFILLEQKANLNLMKKYAKANFSVEL